MTEPQIHVCPLCATYIGVEGGYDGPYFNWNCSHERVVAEPESVSVSVFRNPALLEQLRRAWCVVIFDQQHQSSEVARRRIAEREPGARYIAPPHECTWSPADRRKRAEWRRLGSTGQFSAILKAKYLPVIRDALKKGSMFEAAFESEMVEAQIDTHRQINRAIIPLNGV